MILNRVRVAVARVLPERVALPALVELLLTTALIFLVVLAVRYVFGTPLGPRPESTVGSLALIGIVVGVLLWVVIESRPGRYSGGHVNPAITVPLWILGLCPRERVLPYVGAQLLGSVLGTWLADVATGGEVAEIGYALIRPAASVAGATVLAVEAGVGGVLVLAVAWTVARLPRVPVSVVIGVFVAVQLVALGQWTGGVLSPARQFGSAVLSSELAVAAPSLVGPILGAALAATLIRQAGWWSPSAVEQTAERADEARVAAGA
ncbi:aquaporin [Demequina pelophila]|uniref:aquaporin n=1 Tax=Demequina pelophila TaxID=1638984 RepID=UPI00138E0E30|nr:aquaporin [Demequina pelophila]